MPDSSSIILLPRLTFAITKKCSKQSHGCPWQGYKATNHIVTLRNLPNPASSTYTSAPASGTYNSTHQNSPEPSGSCLRNLQQHTPELSGTFRHLPPEPTPAHTRTLRNLPEPASRTYTSTHTGTLRNHQHTPELSGTCLRNLHQHTSELWNLPEPASGTCSATRAGTHRSLSGLKTPLAYAVGEIRNIN